jgi:Kef-type K+ transport system membrane component KefB
MSASSVEEPLGIPTQLVYLALAIGVLIVPRFLQRFRVPSAITCVALGIAAGVGLPGLREDTTVPLLATLGIVALFLFAGLEVEVHELRRGARVLSEHLAIRIVAIGAGAAVMHLGFALSPRASVLVALAALTPSTGFILDSLSGFGLTKDERFWVKSKAIASELVALAVLFVTVRSTSVEHLLVSTAVLAGLVVLIPFTMRLYVLYVLPSAPKSEFPFLVVLALACAFVTKKLGVYYLVGAFVVGVAVVQMRKELPALSSKRIVAGVELYASFFIPFYFFKAGLGIRRDELDWRSFAVAGLMLATIVPLRVALVALHRRWRLGEPIERGARVGLSLVPTLVFAMVLVEILNETYEVPSPIIGGLLLFTLANTMLPSLVLGGAPPEFDAPKVAVSDATPVSQPPLKRPDDVK